MKNFKKTTLLSLLTVFSFNAQAYVTVGWSNDCDFDESITAGQIQAAIDADEAEIRVTNTQTFTEQVDIGSHSVIIKGSYNSCMDADNDVQSTVLTQISGESFTQAAFKINSSDSPTAVTIDGFEVYDVIDSNGNFNGSGVEIIESTGTVLLTNMYIHHTRGGIEIDNTNISSTLNLNLTDFVSAYNDTFRGGGMKCKSNNMTFITVDGLSGFSFNQVDNIGGGMSLNNCNLIFFGGTKSPEESNLLGINGNIARDSPNSGGGGIAAFSGSMVKLIGSQSIPFNITNNRGKNGAGIYANGFSNVVTKVELTNSWLANNEAFSSNGGAIHASYYGEVKFIASDACQWNDLCHLIENNTATESGGAFFIEASGIIEVNKAEITGSRSGSLGAVAAIKDDSSSITLNNSLIHHNGGADHTEYEDGHVIKNYSGAANISINYSTFADNEVQYTSIAPFNSDGKELQGNLSLVGTVIADDVSALENDMAPDGFIPTSVVNCVTFKEISTNPEIFQVYEQVVEGEPAFIDSANGNYRLHISDTLAMDRCDELSYPATLSTDVDGQARPIDVADVIDDLGTLDIGYDEFFLDLIFKNEFE